MACGVRKPNSSTFITSRSSRFLNTTVFAYSAIQKFVVSKVLHFFLFESLLYGHQGCNNLIKKLNTLTIK